jgi:hypothetical protein
MNRKAFRKISLPGVIFLFSVLVLGQSAWGCDDQDKGGCDHPHHQCYPPLVIQSVDVVFDGTGQELISIYGENFDNGDIPVVTLGGNEILDVNLIGPKEIMATIPSPADFPHSDYRLVVSTGHGRKCKDKYSLTIGAPAAAGPTGRLVTVIVPNDPKSLTNDLKTLYGTAYCDTANGYKVIGGGFEAFAGKTHISVIRSVPLQDDNGWYAEIYIPEGNEAANFNIYAICAKIIQ